MKKVTSIVLNGFTNDSRVLKENLSLKKAGFNVEILALHKKGLEVFEIIEGIPVHRLNASKRNLIQEDVSTNIQSVIDIIPKDKTIEEAEETNNEVEMNLTDNRHTNSIISAMNIKQEMLMDIQSVSDINPEDKTIKDLEYASNETENKKEEQNKHLSSLDKIYAWLKKIRRMMLRQVKLFIGWLRKARRMMLRQVKLFIGWLRKGKRKIINWKNKFFNKFFKLHRLKFNLLFARKCKDSDIIHCNDLLTLPMGVIVKKFYNKDVKIVYDAHEYETELNGLEGGKKRFRKILERSLIKYADKVITVSDSIAKEYVRLYDIDKPDLVLNTPPYVNIVKKDIFRETFNIRQDQTIFLYQGGLVNGRGIEDILASFKEIKNGKSVVVFMGYGIFENTIIEAANKYDNIFFHPAVSPNILLNYTSSADFGISMIEDICLSYRYCLPNKMFEYIMAEVPVIVSNLPEMKKIVEKYKVGVVAQNSGIKGLEEAILDATKLDKQELNQNIRKAKEIFNWEEQEKVLLDVYSKLS